MYSPQLNCDLLLHNLSKVWFTSDTHFGHENIIKYCNRPYPGVPEMNTDLLINWNNTVQPDDTVFHLGDVCMGRMDESLQFVSRLNGQKVLILGNHDRPYLGWFKGEKRDRWIQRYLDAGFTTIHDDAYVTMGNRVFYLNHIPYSGDLGANEDRTAFEKSKLHTPQDTGVPLICGHVHDAWQVQHSPLRTRMVNVGVDVNGFRPVGARKVLELHQ